MTLLGIMNVKDHPRTRGVYGTGRRFAGGPLGSSPHTRGLPYGRRGRLVGRGIIPAHAGFTVPVSVRGAGCGDHPRTRGVYGGVHLQGAGAAGSSPHTRGLLGDGDGGHFGLRIIPAHAGFTTSAWRSSRAWRDHPRTRGVYARPVEQPPLPTGSSPHTRGLQEAAVASKAVGGIIPAHAGFTSARAFIAWMRADHPRTRGVYKISGQD